MTAQNQIIFGMDIAKNVFHLTAINRNNRLVENKRLKRNEVLKYFTNVAPTTVAMEACATAPNPSWLSAMPPALENLLKRLHRN